MHSDEFANVSYEYTWSSSRLMMHQECALGATILFNFFSTTTQGTHYLHKIIQKRLKSKPRASSSDITQAASTEEDLVIFDRLTPSSTPVDEESSERPSKKAKVLDVATLPSKKGLFVVEGEYEENVGAESPGFHLLANKMYRAALTSSQYTMNQVNNFFSLFQYFHKCNYIYVDS